MIPVRVGFAGLGRMGAPMAARIAAHGFPLTAWNRTAARAEALTGPLAAHGARVAGTLPEVAAGSGVVITMLSDGAAARAPAHAGRRGQGVARPGVRGRVRRRRLRLRRRAAAGGRFSRLTGPYSSVRRLSRARSAATASPSALNSSSVMPGRRRTVSTTSQPSPFAITRIGT